MTVFYVLGIMGSGKTLFATSYALKFSIDNPDCKIYANYHIKLPNFEYTPYMYLPYQKLDKCLIICDDFFTLQNLTGFVSIVVNKSRKKDITIILTAQYYTQVPPRIRDVSNYQVQCKYNKIDDYIISAFINPDGKIEFFMVYDVIKNVGNLYDTNEEVPIATERAVAKEIYKYSKTLNDLETNLEFYSNAFSKRKRMKSLIYELNPNKQYF